VTSAENLQRAQVQIGIQIHVAFNSVDTNGYIVSYVLTDGATVLASNRVQHPTPPTNGTPFKFSHTLTNVRAGRRPAAALLVR
jgi:hypothetical protein